MIRIDLHSSTGTKLDIDSISEPITCQYSLALGKVGSFAFSIPADLKIAPSVVGGLQAWIYDSNEGLVFKGKIDSTTYQNDSTGRKVLNVSGPSTAVELQERSVGLGLVFEDDDFGDSVDAILDDTDWSAGVLDTAVNVPARRFDGRQKWEALSALADIYQFSIREDNLNSTVDVGAFGVDSGVILTNLRNDIRVLDDLPTQVPLGSIKVLSRSNDIVNRVYPVGQIQGLGGAVLTLDRLTVDAPSAPTSTRLYLASTGSTPVSPAFDADWNNTNSRYPLNTDRQSTAMATVGLSFTGKSAVGQFIYGPIAQQTITGTIKGQVRAQESNAANNATPRIAVRIVDAAGATRGTLLAIQGVGNELDATNYANHTFPSTALGSVVAEAGDYIVIEFGQTSSAGTTTWRIGDAGTSDLPEDEATTTDLVPWFEFSQYILPQITVVDPEEAYTVETYTLGTRDHAGIQDATSVAAYGLRDRVLNIKDILPFGLTIANLNAAAQTLYGIAVTYLQRHKDPQVAYEVEPIGLRHYDNGSAYWKVGDKLTVDYLGTVRDIDGVREDLRVKQALYIISATRTYDSAGASRWQMVVSTVARALADDSTLLAAMLSDIGITKIAPLPFLLLGDLNDAHIEIEPTVGIRIIDTTGVTRATFSEDGVSVVGDQSDPFFSTTNADGTGATEYGTMADGSTSWLTTRSGSQIRIHDIDKVITGGLAASVNDLYEGVPVHALFMVACLNSGTGAILGHIFGSVAVGGTLYAITTVTSASNGSATAPAISLNGSSGLDYTAHASTNTRFVGIAVVAYS